MAAQRNRAVINAFASSLFEYAEALDERGLTPADMIVAPPKALRDETPLPVSYKPIADLPLEQIQDDTFEWYRPQSIRFEDAKAHPTPLMESAALASTKPPTPTYVALLPKYLVNDGVLSESQLEVVTLAGEAHSRAIELLVQDPNDPKDATKKIHKSFRQGFMVGDGAGAGKGRTTCGIIFDNWHKGRRKALWISENERLYNDAIRDYLALGGDKRNIVKLGRYKIGEPITLKEGVIFATYATLRSKVKRKDASGNEIEITRLDQIMDFLGGDQFDGPLAFDESQNLQNAMEMEAVTNWGWGTKAPSQQALASLAIQEKLSNARVIYSSATSADHLEALAYAPRLGLWGKNTAFQDRGDFINAMDEGGMTALEMICRDLKAMGVYCSRSLSTEGVTYETLVHELSDDQIAQMNSFNKAWRLISTGMEQALVITGATQTQGANRLALPLNGAHVGQVRSRLEGAKQRFYMLALIAMRIPTIIENMKERLAEGESCVLQLHNTQEASLERALDEWAKNPGMALDDLDVSPRRELIDYVRECFPTQQMQRNRNDKGKEISEPVIDKATGMVVENARAIALREDIVANLEHLLVPQSPLDMIIDEFGADNVAEITGRKRRIIWSVDENGKRVRVVDKRSKTTNAKEIEAFMNGPKRILIFSESSGGVGASYHSDRASKNQTRRNHYLVQIPWRSIDAVQGMGRTNRTNQASFPHYVLTTTNVPAELRFISTIARRLDQLGSLTRGQRDANSTYVFSSDDNLETKYGEMGLREMIKVLDQNKFEGLGREEFFKQTGIDPVSVAQGYANSKIRLQSVNIPRFLNRLLAVDIDESGGYQRLLLNDLLGRIEEIKSQAMADGSYDAGLQTISPISLEKLSDSILRTDPLTGAETRLAKLRKIEKLIPIAFASAKDKLRFFSVFKGSDSAAGWFVAPDGTFALHIPVRHMGWGWGVKSTQDDRVRVITPFGETMRDRFDGVRYTPVDSASAETRWNDLIDNGPKTETETFHVVYGALLPIWSHFSRSMPQIWRMQTDDGERILGRKIPRHEVKTFKAGFGIS